MSLRVTCYLICLFVCLYYCRADPVSFIKKCKPSDQKCLKESAQNAIPTYTNGVPELGIEPLEPLHIDKMDASTSGLRLVVTDAVISGLKGCRFKKLTRDLEKDKLMAKIQCDINLEGQYEMSGRLLILPIEGKGPVHVKLRKIILNVEADMDEKPGKDGKNHWVVKSWKHSYELKDKADVIFENLFNGNEVLGRAARELVAANGNEIVIEVGPPVIKTVVTKMINTIKKLFLNVPYEDLVDVQ